MRLLFLAQPLLLAAFLLGGCGDTRSTQSVSPGNADRSARPFVVEAAPSYAAQERRREAYRRDRLDAPGPRVTRNLALDEEAVGWPEASATLASSEALLAIDGDPSTAWRGAAQGPWRWELPFRRVVHLGLLRFHLGDESDQGVPAAFHWEFRPPQGDRCAPDAPWQPLPGGRRDDRDDNTFTHGPRDTHAQRQALFADSDACGLRLVVDAMEGGQGPVLRELKILEGSPSVARDATVTAEHTWENGPLGPVRPRDVVDGSYERFWAGAPGHARWELTLRLPTPRLIDRLRLQLGYDGTTASPPEGHGRRYTGSYLPVSYSIATSHDGDPAHLLPLPEGSPPVDDGQPLPLRRRLVRFSTPRPVQLVRLTITRATGPWGEDTGAPVVRELSLHAADDPRPVVSEPLFFSVDANPSGLTSGMRGGESFSDGLFARAAYHRLRRVLLGFDADTRWTADVLRQRDAGTGRFLEVIEGDDPRLDEPLLKAMAPPPVLLLSGSFDWEFDDHTAPWPTKRGHWRWDVDAPADSDDRGMGQLRAVVQRRSAPLVGFCGGAQILALLEAQPPSAGDADLDDRGRLDAVLLRNDNQPIRGLLTRPQPYERAWWYDDAALDAARPTILFDPHDALFNGPLSPDRRATRELPSSHGDMLRASAFQGPLRRLQMVAWSHFCRPWVDPAGLEPTWVDTSDPTRRCVTVPQAFRSRDREGYPLVGFQFHPEQRDFPRLAPGSPHAARGDTLNLVASTVDLILDAYTRLFWSQS